MISKIRNLEINLLIWFIMGSGVLGIFFNTAIASANVDAWMSPLIGMVIGIIPVIVILKLINHDENLNINLLLEKKWGKFGKIISLTIALFVCTFVMLNFYNLTNFISSDYLYNTPRLFISILFIIPIIYVLSFNVVIISRTTMIFGIISIILFSFAVAGVSTQIVPNNIYPILKDGIVPPIIAGLYYVCYIVLPLFLLTIIPKKLIRNKKKFNKRFIITYIISCITLCLMTYLVISSYGIELSLLYQYPEYNILKRISILSLFDRIESIISLVLVLFIYTTCVMGSYYVKQTCFDIFKLENNKKNNVTTMILIVIILLFGATIFPNNTIGNVIIINIYHILLTIFFFVIPLILMLFTKKKN